MANGYMREIRNRVNSSEDGTIFAASDFADIADANTIRQSMYRLVNDGTLKRILQGIYEKPKYSKLLDEYVAADPDAVAKACSGSQSLTISCGSAWQITWWCIARRISEWCIGMGLKKMTL